MWEVIAQVHPTERKKEKACSASETGGGKKRAGKKGGGHKKGTNLTRGEETVCNADLALF